MLVCGDALGSSAGTTGWSVLAVMLLNAGLWEPFSLCSDSIVKAERFLVDGGVVELVCWLFCLPNSIEWWRVNEKDLMKSPCKGRSD